MNLFLFLAKVVATMEGVVSLALQTSDSEDLVHYLLPADSIHAFVEGKVEINFDSETINQCQQQLESDGHLSSPSC